MKNGSSLFYSGVKPGRVKASISVNQGRYYLIIMNDNILENKLVDVTVKYTPQ